MADQDPERDKHAPAAPEQRVHNAMSIYVLEDGQVVFGDLPPALSEVAAIVAGHEPQPAG